MKENERRFYVRGALDACAQFKVTSDIVASVCRELGLTPEDMAKFVAEEHEAAKAAHETMKVAPVDVGGVGLREIR
jgi:hypothetical protein